MAAISYNSALWNDNARLIAVPAKHSLTDIQKDSPMRFTRLALTTLMLTLVVVTSTANAARKPNIVFIMADDLGFAELGCYGQKKIRTPNIDRLARDGMKFTRNYAGNAVCAPSRCVLMTGKHPGHAWIRSNREAKPEGQAPIPTTEVTIAELLNKDGYTTGAFGKWGLGPPGSEGGPLQQGFDRFFGYNCQRHAHSYYPSYLWDDNRKIPLKNNPPVGGHARFPQDTDTTNPGNYARFKGQDYAPDRIAAQALEFIKTNKDKPFFLYYPSVIPHLALHVPDEALQPYLDLKWDDPPFTKLNGGGYTPHFTPRAAYAAMITRLDTYVGRILSLLEQLGLDDNTIVVFTSDNGTTHLKREVDYDFFDSVKSLRGLKGSLYEGGVRVPLIVKWPGHVPRSTVSDFVTGFEDWIPTLLGLTGSRQPVPKGVDGVSLVATLNGNKQPPRNFLYREFPSYGGQQAVWLGNWKGVRQRLARQRNNKNAKPINNAIRLRIELYNLHDDIGETKNVANQHPDIVAKMKELMTAQHTRSRLFPIQALDNP